MRQEARQLSIDISLRLKQARDDGLSYDELIEVLGERLKTEESLRDSTRRMERSY